MTELAPPIDQIDSSPRSRLEDLTIAAHESLSDPSVARLFGRKHLDRHGQARRVVWVHTGGSFEAPKQAGGRLIPGTHTRVRTVWMRVETFEAHVYAETHGRADTLFDLVVAAMSLVEPSFLPTGFEWASEDEQSAGETKRTEHIVLRGRVRLPVIDRISDMRPAPHTSTPTVGTIQPDDSVDPEPMS